MKTKIFFVSAMACLCLCLLFSATTFAAQYKVLVVMSYEENFPWCFEIKTAIDRVLTPTCNVQYYYMNTKVNRESGDQKAKEVFELFQTFMPDGVITVDDNAQSMFTVPYLKGKVKTPVIFCGVNAEPEEYGYPASNVSGMLERLPFGEAIAFAQQIVPEIKTFGLIIKDDPTGRAHLNIIQKEADGYAAKFVGLNMPKTLREALTMTEELKSKCDLLMVATLQGLLADDGTSVQEKDAVQAVEKAFGKPTVATEEWNVKNGTLCTVVRTGTEQGDMAGTMMLKALRGTPISEIPITRNYQGKRILNVTVLKKLRIKPRPIVLQGAELVKTE